MCSNSKNVLIVQRPMETQNRCWLSPDVDIHSKIKLLYEWQFTLMPTYFSVKAPTEQKMAVRSGSLAFNVLNSNL